MQLRYASFVLFPFWVLRAITVFAFDPFNSYDSKLSTTHHNTSSAKKFMENTYLYKKSHCNIRAKSKFMLFC